MGLALSNELKALLDGANFAHLATLMPDGSPQSVPVWVGREEDRVLICTGEGSLKAKNIRRDPRVALSIVDFHDPYKEAQLRGRVVERRPDGDFSAMDPISHKYTGKPFPFRSPEGRVTLVIEIDGRPGDVDAACFKVIRESVRTCQIDEKRTSHSAQCMATRGATAMCDGTHTLREVKHRSKLAQPHQPSRDLRIQARRFCFL